MNKLPEVNEHLCLSCYRSTPHTVEMDTYEWLLLTCDECGEETSIDLPGYKQNQ